jgi:putative membrane protein
LLSGHKERIMKLNKSTLLAGVILGSLLATSAIAQDTTIHSRSNLSVASSANMEKIPPKQGLTQADRIFITTMAKVHMAEIQCGQIAQRNGGEWGKAYGKDMEHEHNLALEELRKIATTYAIALPTDVHPMTKKFLNTLGRLHDADFDKAYKHMMIEGHTQVLAKVEEEIRSGNNSDVRGYAVTLEPEVKLHLKMAQNQTTMTGPHTG